MKTAQQRFFLSRNPQIFLLCCEFRNFSQVGRAMGLTQSAVSKAIQSFEKELGFTLFIRNCRPLTLTAEAAELEHFLRHVSGDFSQFLARLQNENFLKPVLRLGIPIRLVEKMGTQLAAEILPEVSRLELQAADSRSLVQKLQERKLDLVITEVIPEEKCRYTFRKLFNEPCAALLPRDLAHQHSEWSWKRLKLCGLPLIYYSEGTSFGQTERLFLRSAGISFPERLTAGSDLEAVALANSGFGWTYVPAAALLGLNERLYRLEAVALDSGPLVQDICLVSREGEFLREMQLAEEISRRILKASVFPEILAAAPWLAVSVK